MAPRKEVTGLTTQPFQPLVQVFDLVYVHVTDIRHEVRNLRVHKWSAVYSDRIRLKLTSPLLSVICLSTL